MAFCSGLGIEATLYLGIYNQDHYMFLEHTHSENSLMLSALPPHLISQLLKLPSSISQDFLTVIHRGDWLRDACGEKACLNLVQHPYIFYDMERRSDHSCTVKSALYTADSLFCRFHIEPANRDGLAIDPFDIESCNTEVTVHHDHREGAMISPNNALIVLNTGLPVHFFYTLTIVPFNGHPAKMLVAKHILVIDDQPVLPGIAIRLAFSDKDELRDGLIHNAHSALQNIQGFGIEKFKEIVALMCEGDEKFWFNLMYYTIWLADGKPMINDYGRNQFNFLIERQYDGENPELATSAINYYIDGFVEEIKKWLRVI